MISDLRSCVGRADGLYFHPDSCSKSIGCWSGTVDIQQCDIGKFFNGVYCDVASNVKCLQEQTTVPPIPTEGK